MTQRAVIGIDLGTSQVKALVRGSDGTVLGRGRDGYRVRVPADGQAESDPEAWWRGLCAAVGEATAGGIEVDAVAVTGQMHGVVLSHTDGEPVRDAIVWLDRRAAAEAETYPRSPALGSVASAGMAGPILRWLASHEADAVDRARWVLQPKDWVRLRLTGEAATDPTDASGTLLFDVEAGRWAVPVIEALGLPAEKLPPVLEPAALAGRLLPGAAGELGLRPGIPVAVGASDTAASLHAADPRDNEALLTLGTGGQVIMRTQAAGLAPRLHLFAAAGGGRYHLAATQNAGEVLQWATRVCGVSFEELYSLAARPWAPDTPLFLPYLTEERFDTPAGATWAGITLRHSRDEVLRGVLEGVAFLLRERLEDLRAAGHEPGTVLAGGGGVRDPGFRRLLADVLGLPLAVVRDSSWLSVTGAAMLGQEMLGMTSAPGRSGDNDLDLVNPQHAEAAGAGYERWAAHKRAMAGIGRAAHDRGGPRRP